MTDNVVANAGSGGATFATDDIGGVQHPRTKLIHGADGVNDGDVSTSNGLPVQQQGSWTVTANLSATDNAVLDTIETNTDFGTVTGGGTETGALRVTLANNSTGLVSVDDNGGSLTVDVGTALPAGSNNIGDVDVATQPARAATTDNIGAALMTNVIHNGTTALTPKFAVIDDATSGDNTLVAAVASNKIRVLSYVLVSSGTVNVRFEDGAGGTALTGQMNLVANTGVSSGFNPYGHFETSVNTLLNLELSAAVPVDGHLTYVEVA